LKRLLKKEDPQESYGGLGRIGDPHDGTAVWTLLSDEAKIKSALEKRADDRRTEKESPGGRNVHVGESESREAVPPASQEQNAALNEALVNALAKANGGTCNNSCHCVVA
jgi:hypothetical protein